MKSSADSKNVRYGLSLAQRPWITLLPIGGWQTALYLVPIVLIVLASFWSMEAFRLTVNWNLENYRILIGSEGARASFVTTISLATLVVAFATAIAYPIAYVLAFHVPRRYRLVLLLALIAPFWTNYLVRAYSWMLILAPNGIINYFLARIGFEPRTLEILYTHQATQIGLIHFVTPLMTLLLYVALEGIDPRVMEAASDLGATGARRFFHVVLPLSRPGLATGVMLTFILAFTDFISPAVLGGQARRVAAQLVVDAVQDSVNYPRGAAIAVAMIVIALMAVGILARLVGGKQATFGQNL
jgi:spermidine/putrescine transport system permease protein